MMLPNQSKQLLKSEKQRYKRPLIIHSGQITTRAGSPVSIVGDDEANAIDPADLFGND